MGTPVYVLGHKNPDTDSICSAIGYAAFRAELGDSGFMPARTGEIAAEARFLLDRFGLPEPVLLTDVRTRIQDVMHTGFLSVSADTTLKSVYLDLHQTRGKMAVVQRPDRSLAGIVTSADLAMALMGSLGPDRFRLRANAGKLAEVLEGRLLCGQADDFIDGEVFVGAMSPESMSRFIHPGAVIITGDRSDVQMFGAEVASCLVVTGNSAVSGQVRAMGSTRNIPVIVAPGDTYTVARLIGLARPVNEVMNAEPVVFAPDDLLSDVVKMTREARHRVYPVVEEKSNRVVGLLYRDDLFASTGRRVVLVDHNEISQTVAGIEEARILGVVDHHRIGDIQTAEPIFMRNEPVGSTATIVAGMAFESGVQLPPPVCGALLGAILSDTLVFRSPTCTTKDRLVAQKLAAACGEDPETLGMEMLRVGSYIENFPAGRLIRHNLKEYLLAGSRVAIAQCEVVDISRLLERRDEFLAAMNGLCEERKLDVMIMMFTEVLRSGSHILVTGPEKALIASAFGEKLVRGGFFLPGVLSRKMQILPKVTSVLGG